MYKGSQWFSIMHEVAKRILQEEKFAKKYFYKSFCPDESFVHTIVMNLEMQTIVSNNSLRYIDWKRGRPYVWCLKDYDELISSEALFARKFTYETEDGKELILQIKEYVMKK